MGIENLDRIFDPKSIAVVGASEREGSIGAAIMGNILAGGFKGELHPINLEFEKVWGLPVKRGVADLASAPDLVLIATPIHTSPQIVETCAKAGVGAAVILSAGGKETGEAGRIIEQEILKAAQGSKLRIVGPNCTGFISAASKLNASFANQLPLEGKTAFISQSGSIFTSILDLSLKERIGFSHFISLGGMLDVDFGDTIDYLGGDYRVGSILLYMENLSRIRNFMSAARGVSRIKPIIAFKAGRTGPGSMAALSHTGALAGEDAIYDAAFERAGILRVKTFEELFDCAELLARHSRPAKPDLAILTNAGGPGVMAADALADYGVAPARLSSETLERLDAILPPYRSRGNPVDLLANAGPERYCAAVDICLSAPEVSGLLLMLSPHSLSRPLETAQAVADLLKERKKKGSIPPVIGAWIGGPGVEGGRSVFNEEGIPTFDSPERAVRAFMDLFHHARALEILQQIPPRLPEEIRFDRETAQKIISGKEERCTLSECESKNLLQAYGIPVNPTRFVDSGNEVWRIAKEIGFPVVMKIDSPDILHKSDCGGVRVDLSTEIEVYQAYGEMMERIRTAHPHARISGVTVQPMIKGRGYELIVGAKRDRDFGPVILFGMGGVATELLRDRATGLPPLNRLLARRLMEKTKAWELLKGYRGYPAADIVKVEEILIRLSQLVTDFPEIEEIEINPLIITEKGIIGVDARTILSPALSKGPLHLVISPYPNEQERRAVAKSGEPLSIRPIRPEDAPLFVEMFHALSPQSVYFRFFSAVKSLRHEMLARFTQIDYDRETALVALRKSPEGAEEMLGVARVILERNGKEAEFAVLVRDSWQGKGVGAELLQRCLDIAKARGIEKVWGIVLPENRNMIALGKKLGFNVKRDPESGDFLLTILF